ncbi:MAG: hypothetical protein K2I45_06345, partial [Muribaculaceae bacterium]|nr:hypothetical protein [Muribaculaceae bacterium]
YGPGTKVGFAVSTSGNDFSLLTADVLKMFVIYFYKDGKLVYMKNASSEELDVLNLSLISIGGKGIQTLVVNAPDYDNDGNSMQFDSFGFGIGGVSADVISKISVHYAFVDDFTEVPIIKKYFPNASGSVAGMAFTSGKTLVNNNLEDGVVSSINIGGVYYTVHAGEQLPYGAEVGFVFTSGSALDLNLGKAVELVFIDQFGNEIAKTTQVDAVGVELIGGGKASVNMVIPTAEELGNRPVWGLKLRRISVLDVDLGATNVHYAYVRLPKPREVKYPFVVTMDVIPAASVSYKTPLIGSETYQNSYSDMAMFSNDPDLPLSVATIPESTSDKSSYWTYNALSREWYVELTVASINEGSDGSTSYTPVGYLKLSKEKPLVGDWKYKWYFAKDKSLITSGQNDDLEYDPVTGAVNLSAIAVKLHDITADVDEDMAHTLLYGLYFNKEDSEKPEDGNELSTDAVTVPDIRPEFELAGLYSRQDLDSRDGGDSRADGPSEEIVAGECREYLTVTVPEMIDWKTAPQTVNIYEDGTSVASLSYDAEQEKWVSADTEILAQIKIEGAHKIVAGIVDYEPKSTKKMRVECGLGLCEEYRDYLVESYGSDNLSLLAAMEAGKAYGCPLSASHEYDLPTFDSGKCLLHWVNLDNSIHVMSTSVLTLNDASSASHDAVTEKEGILVNQWMALDLESGVSPLSDDQLYRHVNWLTGADAANLYREDPEYSDENRTVSLKYNTYHKGLSKDVLDTTYPVTTRVYVPVVPSGFSAEEGADNHIEPSYLVVENPMQTERGEDLETGVDDITEDAEDAEYYTLQGVRVEAPVHGLYIVRKGSRSARVMF